MTKRNFLKLLAGSIAGLFLGKNIKLSEPGFKSNVVPGPKEFAKKYPINSYLGNTGDIKITTGNASSGSVLMVRNDQTLEWKLIEDIPLTITVNK